VRGSVVTLFGFGSAQVLRLASNLVLTRLLFPEAFGFMSLSYALLEGLAMFSAVGEGPAIVRDKRGDDPDFLNTAWTVQTIRGCYLWVAACALAFPLAHFYDKPLLMQLVPVVGFTCVLEGFQSTAIHAVKRSMALGRLTLINLISQLAGIAAMIAWAWFHPTVWALPVGGLVSSALLLVLSHACLPGIRNRFRWERESLRTLRDFGKWIFLSSILEFIARQSDRFLLGYYVEMATLGIYATAVNLAEPAARLNMQMSRNVILPALSRTFRETPKRVKNAYYRARLGIDALHLPLLGFLAGAGQIVVDFLYDERYASAGWMLQILCVRTALRCILEPSASVCVAMGAPRYVTLARLVRAMVIVVAIPAGWHYGGGLPGVVWGVSLAELPVLLVALGSQARLGVLSLPREALAFGLMGAGWLVGWLLRWVVS